MTTALASGGRAAFVAGTRGSITAGLTTAAVGGAVLAGWIWHIDALKSVYGPITMKTNAALVLALCGISLAVIQRHRTVAQVCAIAAGLIAGLTLFEHIAGIDLGIDQLLFTEAPGSPATASPNRMGVNASVNVMLAATALLLLARRTPAAIASAQRLALVALTLAAVPTVGYLYGAEALYGIARYTGIALHTALALLVLQVGVLAAAPSIGPVSTFLDEGPAGTMVRGLALPIAAIPLGLGYLFVLARNHAIVDRGLGISLLAVTLVVVLAVTLAHTAQVIERSDRARRDAEHARDQLVERERHARAESERANRLKDAFLATLSHELRTPLNVVLGWTRVLEVNSRPDESARIAARVARNGRLLARLVEDLLDISRITTGHFDIAPVDVSPTAAVQAAFDAMLPVAAAKGLMFTVDADPQVRTIKADLERLHQILMNLTSNAVKFTPSGGSVSIRTGHTPEAATITVRDTGVGFDRSFAPDLFTPFRQADSSSRREHGGLGLGLSISRHLAERHGGSLTGASDGIGRGATFTLMLPYPVTRTAAAETPTRVAATAVAATIAEERVS